MNKLKYTLVALLTLVIFAPLSTLASQSFWGDHALITIISSKCPHCQAQGRVMKKFYNKYPIPSISYSADGMGVYGIENVKPLPPNLIPVAFPNGNVVTPAFFIINQHNYQLYPVGVGEMSMSALKERIEVLAEKIIEFEGQQS